MPRTTASRSTRNAGGNVGGSNCTTITASTGCSTGSSVINCLIAQRRSIGHYGLGTSRGPAAEVLLALIDRHETREKESREKKIKNSEMRREIAPVNEEARDRERARERLLGRRKTKRMTIWPLVSSKYLCAYIVINIT